MALKVWLPLNGNARNIGINSGNIISSGTLTYQDDYLTAGSGDLTMDYTMNSTTTDYSICFWANMNSTDRMVFGTNSSNNWCIYFTSKICANVGDSAESYFNKVPVANEWHHYIVTISSKVIKLYIDGVYNSDCAKYHDINCTKIRISGWFANTSYKWDGKVKDFRIYDECLSQKQIKEISKGLVAHYRLSMPGQENMLINSKDFSGWSIGSGWVKEIETNGDIHYKYSRTGATSNAWNRIIPTLKMTPSNYPNGVAVSFDFKVDDLSAFNHQCICALQNYDSAGTRVSWVESNGLSNYINGDKVQSGKWIRLTKLWTQAQLSQGTDCAYSQLSFQLTQNGTIYIKNIKCEPGDKASRWMPNKADTLYTALGYDKILNQDSSGYGYHGKIDGTLKAISDSCRYETSVNFNTPGYLHYLTSPINVHTDAFTYSVWFKPDINATMALYNDRTVVSGGFSLFYTGGSFRFDTGTNNQMQATNAVPTLNQWNHVVVTFNKTTGKKVYLNGELKDSTTNPGELSTIGQYASIGNSSTNGAAGAGNQVYGNLSDARIYCTELSASDILTLYKSSGIIDNKGNAYAYEFIEEA